MRSNRYNRPVIYAAFAWSGSLLCSVPQFFIFRKDEYGNCEADYTAKWQVGILRVTLNTGCFACASKCFAWRMLKAF